MSTSRSISNNNNERNNEPASLRSSKFNQLSSDVISDKICAYLLPEGLGMFARTSHKAEQETIFLRLLHAAVYAAPASYKTEGETKLAALTILKRHPEFLFQEGIVTDHFGRVIKASPYQLFLGAGDIWALKEIDKIILPLIKDGEAQAQKQFQAQFPHCPLPFDPNSGEAVLYDARNAAQIVQVVAQLQKIVAAITADPCTDGQATLEATTKAVKALHDIFAPTKGEIIQTGLHFPLGIMNEIYKVYGAQDGLWIFAQLSFFSRAVIGATEAALTVVDGQCIKNELKDLENMKEKGPDRQDGLFCRHPKGIPTDKGPLVGQLGVTMFVDPYYGYSCVQSSPLGYFDWYNKNSRLGSGKRVRLSLLAPIGKLMEQKQQSMGAIMQSRKEKSTHRLDGHDQPMRCVIL